MGAESIGRPFDWSGGRRTGDGRWSYEYDQLGRLVAVDSIDADRRIEYRYGPTDRIAQRVAKRKTDGGVQVENRADVLVRDGLPAETTFLWDVVTDRLVAIYESAQVPDAGEASTARLLRQYVHGDRGYDDPIEVLIASAPGGTPRRLYPILDPLGGGSIEAVVDEHGALVERVLYADAYGDAPRYLHGPVIDRIELEIEKAGSGELAYVRVRAHASDRLDASLMQGLRIRALMADGSSAPMTGTTLVDEADPFAAVLTIAGTEWQSRTLNAASVEIVVLDSLTSPTWAHAPPQPAPTTMVNPRRGPSCGVYLCDVGAASQDWEETSGRVAEPGVRMAAVMAWRR